MSEPRYEPSTSDSYCANDTGGLATAASTTLLVGCWLDIYLPFIYWCMSVTIFLFSPPHVRDDYLSTCSDTLEFDETLDTRTRCCSCLSRDKCQRRLVFDELFRRKLHWLSDGACGGKPCSWRGWGWGWVAKLVKRCWGQPDTDTWEIHQLDEITIINHLHHSAAGSRPSPFYCTP